VRPCVSALVGIPGLEPDPPGPKPGALTLTLYSDIWGSLWPLSYTCAITTYGCRCSSGVFPLVKHPRVELGFSCIPSKQVTVSLVPDNVRC
jgi:hypothetical protein